MAGEATAALQSRLDALPPLVRDVLVGLASIILAVSMRVTLDLFVSDAVPFALTFPAVIAAALLAGWRAAIISITGCQLLVWYFVMEPRGSFAIPSAGAATSLVLTTVAQLLSTWAVVAFRTSSRRLAQETARRLNLLGIAQREIDHRTKNNFQLAISILLAQAAQADSKRLADQLKDAAARLQRIAGTYRNLSVSSVGISEIALDSHVAELCDSLRGTIVPAGVRLNYEGDAVTVPAEQAVAIGLVANEWITNAAKHAFDGSEGDIEVKLSKKGGTLSLSVADGGCGIKGGAKQGLGSTLTNMLTESLRGRTRIDGTDGTRCVLEVPL